MQLEEDAPTSAPPTSNMHTSNTQTPDGSDRNELWRQHFPVDAEAENERSRREFLGGLTIAGGVLASGQIAMRRASVETSHSSTTKSGNSTSSEPLLLECDFTTLDVGAAIQFHYPDEKTPCLLIKTDEKNFVAYAQKCTHLACPVIPDVGNSELHCPCHHGVFDLHTGEPKSGPPRAALAKIDVRLKNASREIM